MNRELQSILEAPAIHWPALRHHNPCMAHVIPLAVCAFRSSLSVKVCTKCSKAHARDQQFKQNESIVLGKSQRIRNAGNARIHKLSALRPGLAKIIEKVFISKYIESPETNLHIAEDACCIDYSETWLLKEVLWLSKCQSAHPGTTHRRCQDTLEFDTGVALVSLPITRIHPWMAPKSLILWILATLQNTGWMDNWQVGHGGFEDNPIHDPLDVEETYGQIGSLYHCLQCHVQPYGWRYASLT